MELPQLEHPCVMVGNYSEAFHQCSYNDHDVLLGVLSTTLNAKAKWLTQEYPERTRGQLGTCYREDGLYEEALWVLMLQHRGWPHDWLPAPVIPIEEAVELSRLEWNHYGIQISQFALATRNARMFSKAVQENWTAEKLLQCVEKGRW